MREMMLLAQLSHAAVGQECATLREWASIQKGKHRPPDFLEYLFATTLWSDDVKANVHVGLKGQKVRHSEDARVDGRRMLDLERALDGPALEPMDVNLFDGLQGTVVVVEGNRSRIA